MKLESLFSNNDAPSVYIIAEIGGNFTTLEEAKRLIDEAYKCGVDAVKLQTYRADTVASKNAMFDMENTGRVSQHEIFKKYEIGKDLHREVFEYAGSLGLDWFSTPAHETDVDMLEELGVGVHKIGSDDAVNIPFLKYVARTNKPIILSTGMSSAAEIRESVSAIVGEGNDRLILLQATSNYPTHPENVNLLAMQTLMQEYPDFPVGYSDHTIGTTACICAAAMGARVIEKHFTYDKNADGPDHLLSADSAEMNDIVKTIGEYLVMRGAGEKRHAAHEDAMRVNTRKSVVVETAVGAGEVITRDHLAIKRPGHGIPPKDIDNVVGMKAVKNLKQDDILTWDDLTR